MGRNGHEAPAFGLVDADEEPGIGLLVYDCIFFRLTADGVAHHPPGAVIVVQHRIEQHGAIIGPDQVAARVRDAVGQGLAGGQVAEKDCITFRPVEVERIGQQSMIR